jgi:thiamine transport system substrate-binding protein
MHGSFILASTLLGATAVAGCGSTTNTSPLTGTDLRGSTITVASHDSWAMTSAVMAQFTSETGIKVKISKNGDVGALSSKLVLTNGDPIADGVFGLDNTFATRATDAGALAPYVPAVEPATVHQFALAGSAARYLTPIDYGDVCANVDDGWFAKHKLAVPTTFDDLASPAYKNLMVTPGASSSSTGLAFLLGTIGRYGDGWKAYWTKLVANGLKIDNTWQDAYEVDFTAGGGKGAYPIVMSYSSSPPFTVPKGASKPTTSALLNTCFRQVEYAGVLKGAKNPLGMQKFISFMLGRQFQAALPDEMYVYPVDTTVPLPAGWSTWAPTATKPYAVAPTDITKNRTNWLRDWRDLTSG